MLGSARATKPTLANGKPPQRRIALTKFSISILFKKAE
jgi:hypothetical protein